MIELFIIGIPSTFLTIQPNKNRVTGHFLWNVLQKSLPGVIAIIFGVVVTYLLNYACNFGVDITKTIVVVTTTFIGLMILYLACRPFTWQKITLFVCMAVCCVFLTSQAVFQKPYIGLFNITDLLAGEFNLQNLIITYQVDGKEVINLTAVLLTLCLVALSYIIMSVSTYIISIINKVAIVKIINKAKQEVQEVDDISEFIEQENEY